jgi:hypothetical protein
MDTKNLKGKLGTLNIEYNSIVTMCYTKRREQIKVRNKAIIQNRLNERQAYYDEIKTELPYLNGINEGKLNMGFNLFFDLVNANTIFSNNSSMISKLVKPKEYWDFIMRYLSELPLDKYPMKTMVIHVDEFSGNIVTDLSGRGDSINPIAYLYILMRREPEEFFKLGNMDILLTNNNGWIMRLNPAECKKMMSDNSNVNIATLFRKELFRLMNKQDPEENSVSSEVDSILAQNREEISKSLIDKYVFGAAGNSNIPEEVKNKIEIEVEKALDKNNAMTEVEVKKELEQNVDLMKEIVMANNKGITKSTASSKRDELLREKQLEINVRGKSLDEILKVKSEEIEVPINNINEKVETFNTNMTDVRFPNIDKAYVEELMEKDLVSMFTMMNDKSIKVFVRSISCEDTSDISNYKETYTIELEDELRVRHKLVFDVPKIIDGRFLYLGGNRKYINNQQLLLPIVKVEPDTVQLVSNYNKIFIRRYGEKVSSVNEKMKKALSEEIKGIRVQRGKFDDKNSKFVTTIDYDDLSKLFKEININGTRIIFDQQEIRNMILGANIKNLESKVSKLFSSLYFFILSAVGNN